MLHKTLAFFLLLGLTGIIVKTHLESSFVLQLSVLFLLKNTCLEQTSPPLLCLHQHIHLCCCYCIFCIVVSASLIFIPDSILFNVLIPFIILSYCKNTIIVVGPVQYYVLDCKRLSYIDYIAYLWLAISD